MLFSVSQHVNNLSTDAQQHGSLQLANNTLAKSPETASVKMRVSDYDAAVQCFVLNMNCDFDISHVRLILTVCLGVHVLVCLPMSGQLAYHCDFAVYTHAPVDNVDWRDSNGMQTVKRHHEAFTC